MPLNQSEEELIFDALEVGLDGIDNSRLEKPPFIGPIPPNTCHGIVYIGDQAYRVSVEKIG